jgi:hypothetical protein
LRTVSELENRSLPSQINGDVSHGKRAGK